MIGQVINKYRIDAKLGEGGMGIVYKAWDMVLERPVALKMMHPSLAQDEKFLQRFRAEAKVLAQLENSHIVTVFNLQETESGLFIVMQFVEGVTLAEKIQQSGPLPYIEAIAIVKQLLESLRHAHQAGVIHRDVKPGNVMITPAGIVKIMDFGLAKVQHGSIFTLSKITGGTLHYMPPEQLRNLANVDRRSDIYSTGMTLYEMLAGRLPFERTEDIYALSKIIVEGKHLPPDRYHAAVPKDLAKIVMRAITREPKRRYQKAEEMLEAIESFEVRRAPAAPLKPRRRMRLVFEILWSFIMVFITACLLLFTSLGPRMLDKLGLAAYARLSIMTAPEGAEVRLDGKLVRQPTPLHRHRVKAADTVNIFIRKPGYAEIDTSMVLQKRQDLLLSFQLRTLAIGATAPATISEPASSQPELGGIEISAEPAGASIFLNGKLVGKTRYVDTAVPVDRHRLLVRHRGYKDSLLTVVVRRGETTRLAVRLTKLWFGKLAILVKPSGSIYIDEMLRAKNTASEHTFNLAAGLHQVSVQHDSLGQWEKEIEIKPDQPNKLLIDFTRKVKLTVASDPWGEIWVDNTPTGYETPKQFELTIGKHTIEVRRRGYVLQSGAKVINLEDDLKRPLQFKLEKIE
jgi:tRNA A-37 threonylcarbamoyl transferase component Bud32